MTPSLLALACIACLSRFNKIDERLVYSIIKTESNFNAKATGLFGEVGLMQIRPEYSDYTASQLKNECTNIREGIRKLIQYRTSCSHKNNFQYVVCYNRGLSGARGVAIPTKDSYYRKVLENYQGVSYDEIKLLAQQGDKYFCK